MYIGCGRLSIIITEGQMRIFLMTPVGVVVTTRGRERVKVEGTLLGKIGTFMFEKGTKSLNED